MSDFTFDVTKTKYKLICSTCKVVIGYTNHRFISGDILEARKILSPDGSLAEVGQKIHRCPGGSIQLVFNNNVKEKNTTRKRTKKKGSGTL